ncbi:hypothetical protein M8756_02935 [Lutimaribacter sp. EGI FJ00015]|uniref:Uncharacterized protein n=1 Tax=Lutimaribacter degradans TaxID=2945989 RepID=A0ACC5ZRT2_9RHOB|nr:hypothetical protein [Lutimaribacter sp. EGI FJ00013]MCM2560802.1 hypothetical protein [Lutimaribacter sp. EGI FJ00013]MCO0612252.1 hypothetical protein [Lutimaribacter sp. EGI FJ00015]MCO0634627.1 hypothetical protein [Lutimaribacter sp. EGI FJ00014]
MSDLLPQPFERLGLGLSALRRALPMPALPSIVRRDHRLARRDDAGVSVELVEETAGDVEARRLHSRGQFLARQEMWETLGQEIRHHDRGRTSTEAGAALADLLSRGARADVVGPIETVLSDPTLMPAHAPRDGVWALQEACEDHPDDYGVALVIVQTHIDIGRAARGQGPQSKVPEKHMQTFHRHFDTAGEILDRFDAFAENSPALAAARCSLLAASRTPQARIADDYEDLIDLDPGNPVHMRALGKFLLPQWYGDYDQLEHEARRTLARTGDIWGMGAYAWVYLDAIALDSRALVRLDVPCFIDALRDILKRRSDQHVANQLAAFCAVTLTQPRFEHPDTAHTARELRGALGWILRRHLHQVYPLVWAAAAQPHGSKPLAHDELMRLGRDVALRRIGRHFNPELRSGMRVVITRKGVALEPLGG